MEIKIGNPEMYEIWKNYTQTKKTNKQRAEMEAVKAAKPFLNLCLRNFKVRKEYWPDFYSYLLLDFFRALDSYKDDIGVKPFGWVWRLCSQCAWRYIRDKQREIEKTSGTFSMNDYDEEIDDVTPEAIMIEGEHTEQMHNYVREYLKCIYRNPLEIELYMRMNGLCGYQRTTNIDDLSEQMNLSNKTIEQMITRNNNDNSKFRKWLKENRKDTGLDFDTMYDYRSYAISKRKK